VVGFFLKPGCNISESEGHGQELFRNKVKGKGLKEEGKLL